MFGSRVDGRNHIRVHIRHFMNHQVLSFYKLLDHQDFETQAETIENSYKSVLTLALGEFCLQNAIANRLVQMCT
jgi:hypothetical protein